MAVLKKEGLVTGFKKATAWFGGIWKKTEEKESLFCHRCKEKILDETAFMLVRAEIIKYSSTISPQVFTCPEQAYNFAQGLIMHPQCWIDMLREYGVELYNMDKVAEEYKKKLKTKKG